MTCLKICGLCDRQNIAEALALEPDFVGFIFYEKSPRNVTDDLDLAGLDFGKTKKVGVFVDAAADFIFEKTERLGLEIIQLHGSETPGFCHEIRQKLQPLLASPPTIFKAFGVDENFDFKKLEPYFGAVDFFLFDTKTAAHGGSGQVFDWSVLKKMPPGLPWILSGGLGIETIGLFFEKVKNGDLPRPFAIDVNSKFEVSPGFKNVADLRFLKSMIDHQ